ncbi:MAG: 2-isopropylmalate synthase [Helicobacteraceae bacterium]|jgi:2-isopropylmalate synthase|nr:2-isopropylmalate synthase [Helicobacteraceae bacterium]
MARIIKLFDTTLRDGEQSPGASMTTPEKVRIAKQLEKLGVDIIEAGFAIASGGDFAAISQISEIVTNSIVCSLARATAKDIERAAEALKNAKKKRIHTFIATSPIHMEYKLKMKPNDVIARATSAVKLAKSLVDDVEFSCEDATRSETAFLKEIIAAAIEAGAGTINIPDTVGYAIPFDYQRFVGEIVDFVGDKATVSVHCHNDLGLASANSLAAILGGANQVECTINGLGERAGNASLEEIAMTLRVRKDLFGGADTRINAKEIYASSRLLAETCGIEPQPNKAIVGKNAFAHESGIHQDGVLKRRETYEIMSAEDIGLDRNRLTLGKLSGSHAFRQKLKELGFEPSEEEFARAFDRFKELADRKKTVYDEDIRSLLTSESANVPAEFTLVNMQLTDCSGGVPFSTVTIRKANGEEITDAAIGGGTIDAVFKAIDRVCGFSGQLLDYKVDAVSEGKDALARVLVKVVFDDEKPAVMGHGLDVDTMKASAEAYVGSLNSYLAMKDALRKVDRTSI